MTQVHALLSVGLRHEQGGGIRNTFFPATVSRTTLGGSAVSAANFETRFYSEGVAAKRLETVQKNRSRT